MFITFEGGEGSGKSTIIKMIEKYLKDSGYNVVVTREPGGVDTAEDIREVILNRKYTYMDKMTEVLLYAASRNEHLVHKVQKALDDGCIVLCDRFVDSSVVYQGYVRGVGVDLVSEINSYVVGNLVPDLTLLLDVSPEVGLSRINSNKEREKNRLDLEGMEFHNKVREGYLLLNDREDRFVKINAENDLDSVFEECLKTLKVKIQGI